MSDDLKLMDNAYKWLNMQIKAEKMRRKQFSNFINVSGTFTNNEIQITGIEELAKILDIDITRETWSGNESCNTNWDIIYFQYRNYKFFELTDKEY